MDWGSELARFGVHAAAAGALVALVLLPARRLVGRLVAAVAAARPGRYATLVVLLCLGVRLALVPAVRPVYEADVREYVEKAAAICRDGHPRAQETRPDGRRFYRPLGWSLPLAGWYRVTGLPDDADGRVRSAQVFGALVAAAVAWMLLALGRASGDEAAGRLAALAYAVFVPALFFSLIPYSETWTTLLVVTAALAFEKLRTGRRPWAWACVLGLATGWIAITRTELAFLAPLAAALLVLARGPDRARRALFAATSLAVFLVPLAVNHEMRSGYDGHLRTSMQGGLILFFGNNPIEVTGDGNATPAVVAKKEELYAKDPSGGLARDEALAWMEDHPFEVLANVPKKLYHLWLVAPQGFTWHVQAGRDAGTDARFAWTLGHAAWVEALALLALGLAGLSWNSPAHRLWILTLVLHAAIWALLAASARNRYPLEPFLMLAAGGWLAGRAGRVTSDPAARRSVGTP